MENTMPDIKSELSKVLTEWEPKRDINVTKSVFDYVQANPGTRASTAAAYLNVTYGFKPASTTSLMAQMVRSGSMRREDSCYYVTCDTYVPIKPTASPRRVKKPKAAVVVAPVAPVVAPAKPKFDMESIITSLSVREAFDLYRELHEFFGATK
jgi:hypothetical protein